MTVRFRLLCSIGLTILALVINLYYIFPSEIHTQGQMNIRQLLGSLLLTVLFFGILMLLLLERIVLTRLTQLIAGMQRLRLNNDLSTRLHLPGRDELTTIAATVNAMLEELEQSQQQLKSSEARYRAIVEDQTEFIARLLPDGTLVFVNDALCRYHGVQREQMLGKSLLTPVYPEDIDRASHFITTFTTDNPVGSIEVRLLLSDGSIRWHQWTVRAIFDAAGCMQELQAVGRDITERKEAEDRLNYLAYYDGLTGLANRLLFKDRLVQALASIERSKQNLGIALLDLDRFKEVNDILGHDIGDKLLKQVADRLCACVRKSDAVARVGGDEFLFLFQDIKTPRLLEELVRRIVYSFRTPFYLDGHEIHISPSIGICIAPNDGDTVETLLKNADVAMYQAKEDGRNVYQFFSPEMAETIMQRRAVEDRLRKAIEQDELCVYYQPVIDRESGAVSGVEALVRWQHPDRGLLPPSEFVPIAEESDLITHLDIWVLEQACRQSVEWQQMGISSVRMAVNISPRHFHHPGLVESIARILFETAMEPTLLELEITESIAMHDLANTLVILNQLTDMGVCIVIDDFGTGYSSLNYVRQFPVDTIKIDGSFLRDVPANKTNTSIVQATIDLAHALGRRVTVEAVENSEQFDFLKNSGCDRVQGYFFGKPMPAEEITMVLFSQAMTAGKP